MIRSWQVVMVGLVTLGANSVSAQNTQRGAVMGGLGGAIAGAIIGENNDKAGAGAAIGGAIGALGGAVIGNARDKELNQQRYYQQHAVPQHSVQQHAVVVTRQAVSTSDVINMAKSGLSDSVIINQIQTRGVQRRLEVPDIISLHQLGVSDTVITYMQQAPVGGPAPTYVAPAQPQTIIVEERYPTYYAPPPPVYYHRSYQHHHSHGGRW